MRRSDSVRKARSFEIYAIRTLAFLIAGGVIAFCTSIILSARQDAKTEALAAASNLTLAIAQGVGKDFKSFNQSLGDIAADLRDPALQKADPAVRRKALFEGLAKSPYIDDIIVLDKNGSFVEDAHGFPWSRKKFSNEDYFLAQRQSDGLGLYVSRPTLSSVEGDDWILTLSRRISDPSGGFGGVVAATLSLGYFESLFDNLKRDHNNMFAIIRDDGSMIIRQPFRMGNIGRAFVSPRLMKEISSNSDVIDETTARTDGVRRIYSFAQVHNLPLVVSVGLAKDEMFASWLHKAEMTGAMTAGLLAAMAIFAWLLTKELTRRQAAERELHALAAQLSIAAKTDGLTGLSNRRAFDELSEREWRRAIREEKRISILIVDVDHFKLYNDRYGHQCGDSALISVAHCIQGQLKRPLDIAARYGGEEFVALLPDTDLEGAWEVAELIRQAILRQRLESGGSLTVSIGAASFSPQIDELFCDAFTEADAALYQAKNLGRNRTSYVAELQKAAMAASIPGGASR